MPPPPHEQHERDLVHAPHARRLCVAFGATRDQDTDPSVPRHPCGVVVGRSTVFGNENVRAVLDVPQEFVKDAQLCVSFGAKRDQDIDPSATRGPCGLVVGRSTVFGNENVRAVLELGRMR
ncbi:hypothetical protein PsYK624_171910 [Phanerochaete sordida]|uniref:Uncharacterized protein n=1 Tax=Phanerochaete sordida TaxID=48140 RepID=A0A9P3LPU9_9APHY|nr:hypothetical protein PsYK624_171910 [Phanerochaete sordida]